MSAIIKDLKEIPVETLETSGKVAIIKSNLPQTQLEKYEDLVASENKLVEKIELRMKDLQEKGGELQKEAQTIIKTLESKAQEEAQKAYNIVIDKGASKFKKELDIINSKLKTQQEVLMKATTRKYEAQTILNYLTKESNKIIKA